MMKTTKIGHSVSWGALALVMSFTVGGVALAVTTTVPNVTGVTTDAIVDLPRINAAANPIATAEPSSTSVVVVNVKSKTYVVTASGKTRNNSAPHKLVNVKNNNVVATPVQAAASALRVLVDGNNATNPPKSVYIVQKRPNPAAPAAADALATLTANGTLP